MAAKSKKSLEPVPMSMPSIPHKPEPSLPAQLTLPLPGFSYEALTAFSRETIDAATKSNAALSAGMEAMGQELMVYARGALKSASETARGLLDAKTFEDVVRLQTDLARRSFEDLVAGSVKLSELGAAVASETFAPWEGRVEAAMTRFAPPTGKSEAA